ncbi:MAG: hypothetical protein ACR2P2_02565 [Nakamurella sp.]
MRASAYGRIRRGHLAASPPPGGDRFLHLSADATGTGFFVGFWVLARLVVSWGKGGFAFMSTVQYALNLGLLVYILASNLGHRRLSPARLVVPVVLVVIAGWVFLRGIPTRGHDLQLEVVGLVVGAMLGVLAGLLVGVRRTPAGELLTRAGAAYAVLWIVVIGGRVAFAYGAEHWFAQTIGRFSMTHQITGADAWTGAFVLMALAMVLVRVLVTATRARVIASAARVAVA